jgi:triacylglycerol esterase/lipase EstA (alpha/beta hydrolase family)
MSSAEEVKAAHLRKVKDSKKKAASKAKAKPNKTSYWSQPLNVLSLAFVLLVAAAGISYAYWTEVSVVNGCAMTYSRPNFTEVPVPRPKGRSASECSNHKLWRYTDGRSSSATGSPPHQPVLFVPGHLGSHTQARSLGSTIAQSADANLQLFSLDFSGEVSALHDSMVWTQARFLIRAVAAIRALYPEPAPAVILVGHSYGGIAARAAFTLQQFKHGSVSDVITLGTPHVASPFALDSSMSRVHTDVNTWWQQHAAATTTTATSSKKLQNVTLISLNGGSADSTVHAADCNATGLALHTVSADSNDIQNVGFGIDHQALVWCKQFITQTTRALTAMTAATTTDDNTAAKRLAAAADVLMPNGEKYRPKLHRIASISGLPTDTSIQSIVKKLIDRHSTRLLLPLWTVVSLMAVGAALVSGLTWSGIKAKKGTQHSTNDILSTAPLMTPEVLLMPAVHLHFRWIAVAVKYAANTVLQQARQNKAIAASCVFAAIARGVINVTTAVTRWKADGTSVATVIQTAAATVLPLVQPVVLYCICITLMLVALLCIRTIGTVCTSYSNGVGKVMPLIGKHITVASVCSIQLLLALGTTLVLLLHVTSVQPVAFRAVKVQLEIQIVHAVLCMILLVLMIANCVTFSSRSSSTAANSLHHKLLCQLLVLPVLPLQLGKLWTTFNMLTRTPYGCNSGITSADVTDTGVACAQLLMIIAVLLLAVQGRAFPMPRSVRPALTFINEMVQRASAAAANGKKSVDYKKFAAEYSAGANNSSTNNSAKSAAVTAAASQTAHSQCVDCFHEDGGVHALYEQTTIDNDSCFRVVSCNCIATATAAAVSKNSRANAADMCEYCKCKCKTCGGGGLSDYLNGSYTGSNGFSNGSSSNSFDQMPTVSFAGVCGAVFCSVIVPYTALALMRAPYWGTSMIALTAAIMCMLHYDKSTAASA